MSDATTYFWRKDKLEILDYRVTTQHFNQSSMFKYLYCPCVIERAGFADKRCWVGHFSETEHYKKEWTPMWERMLPDEFKLALLLLGVQL